MTCASASNTFTPCRTGTSLVGTTGQPGSLNRTIEWTQRYTLGTAKATTNTGSIVDWVGGPGPVPIPPGLLDRVMYLGTPTTARDGSRIPVINQGPQAHLAIQGPGTDPLPPHFHGVEQFQLFVSGSGRLGRHPVAPGVVHYTDRQMVYGPLAAGPTGMAYATLRAWHDPGASFMPGARAELAEELARSNRSAADRRNLTLDLGGGRPGTWSDVVAYPDGLRVAVASIGPGARLEIAVQGGGAYIAVVGGGVADGTGPGGVAWVPAGSTRAVLGGQAGASLALLQFPRRASPERASNTSR